MITELPAAARQIIADASLESGIADNYTTDDIQQPMSVNTDQPDAWEDIEDIDSIKVLDDHA
jgi:hypothetical protein